MVQRRFSVHRSRLRSVRYVTEFDHEIILQALTECGRVCRLPGRYYDKHLNYMYRSYNGQETSESHSALCNYVQC